MSDKPSPTLGKVWEMIASFVLLLIVITALLQMLAPFIGYSFVAVAIMFAGVYLFKRARYW